MRRLCQGRRQPLGSGFNLTVPSREEVLARHASLYHSRFRPCYSMTPHLFYLSKHDYAPGLFGMNAACGWFLHLASSNIERS